MVGNANSRLLNNSVTIVQRRRVLLEQAGTLTNTVARASHIGNRLWQSRINVMQAFRQGTLMRGGILTTRSRSLWC
jgi:hypothetical protein